MPVPQHQVRDIGHAAVGLDEKRGTGRRMRAYRAWLKDTVRMAYPPRVAVVGAGDGVEVSATLKGIRSAAKGPPGAGKCVYVVGHTPEDMRKAIRAEERNKVVRCKVVNEVWPCHEAVSSLGADGGFWFSTVVVCPTRDAGWAIEALKVLSPLFDAETLIVVCRAGEPEMRQVARALEGRGWGGIEFGDVAALQRRGGPVDG